MRFILLISLPPVSLSIYALWRYASGRPLSKRTLNVLYAILLSGYFFSTAGLGIFWVANQELPVFDLHYLFGYTTLTLVLVHLAFNWKALSIFLMQRSPQSALVQGRRSWRAAVRTGASVAGLILFGGVCFWMGRRHGTTHIVVSGVPEAAPQIALVTGARMPGAVGGRQPASGVPAETPSLLPRIGRQMVSRDGLKRSLAEYYHDETKHSRLSVVAKRGGLDWSTQPEVFKQYPGAEVIDLPAAFPEVAMSAGEAIEKRRRRVESLSPAKLSLRKLSLLLHLTNGVTGKLTYPGWEYHLRAAPSAGALYPTVTYLLVNNVEGLKPGLYHYKVNGHKLHRLREGELAEELAAAVARGGLIKRSSVVFIFSGIFFRSSWKYRERSYRYCLLDAGHLAGNLSLGAKALGYDTVLLGRFDDRKVNRLLDLEEGKEGVLLIAALGRAAGLNAASVSESVFSAAPKQFKPGKTPLLSLMHGHTYLSNPGKGRGKRRPPPDPIRKTYPKKQLIVLPRKFNRGDRLVPTIERRRSVRKFSGAKMTLQDFSSMLYFACGMTRKSMREPSVEDNNALHFYVVTNNVKDLARGVYYYHRDKHALSLIKNGDFRRAIHAVSLFQRVVGDSAMVVIKTMDLKRLSQRGGDRGYRYAVLDAGSAGNNLYVQGVALNLGVTGIGAFFDDEVSALIQADPNKEAIIYITAAGVKAPGSKR